jgi:hypothetical protein
VTNEDRFPSPRIVILVIPVTFYFIICQMVKRGPIWQNYLRL